jgi:hypothetical protein
VRRIELQLEHEPAMIAGLAIGAVGAAHAARRKAPLSVVMTPLLAGAAAGWATRGAVTPVRKVRDPELLRPPWMLDDAPDSAPADAPAIVDARLTVGEATATADTAADA